MTGMSVLVVDDEPLARRRLVRLLAKMDWVERVDEAGNVEQAYRQAEEQRPDILLLDIQMPGGNGFEVLERLAEPLDVEALARHAYMSPRTFARRFVAETGESPKRWLTAQRIHHARRLLETTNLPIEDVATRSGFSSAAALRIHFHRATSTRPTAYRRTFRAA